MDPMTRTPEHAKPGHRAEGRIAAWLGLVIAGGTTVTFNVWHATHSGMPAGLGIVEGIAPVALAMVVSHLVATYSGGKVMRGVTFAVMVGAMVLSVGATGAVVHPAARALWWLFGAVIDTAALACLQVLLSLKSRAADEAQQRAAEEAAADDERTALRAELEALRDAAGTAGAEHEAARAELAQALGTAQRELAAVTAKAEALDRKLEAATARKRAAATGRKPARATARKQEPATGSATAPEAGTATAPDEAPADLDSEAKVLWYLDKGHSASRAGKLAGLTDSRGRQIARDLAKAAPKGQDPQQ